MSEKESSSATTPEGVKPLSLEELSRKRDQVYGSLLDQLKPWLLEFGNWIFGGLIAFSLVIVATLLTVGPAHIEVVAAIAIFACALPLDVVGLISVRLIKDMNAVAIDDLMLQAFRDAEIPVPEDDLPPTNGDSLAKKRIDVGLRYAMRLAGLCILLTLLAMVAALWYMAWWVAGIFIIMIIVSLVILINVVPNLMRPDAEANEERKQRYREQHPR